MTIDISHHILVIKEKAKRLEQNTAYATLTPVGVDAAMHDALSAARAALNVYEWLKREYVYSQEGDHAP